MSIERSYNSWAIIYDTNENKTRDLDEIVTKTVLSKYGFSNIIELGSGTGKNTTFLLEKAANITCLDFSQEMLNVAKNKINDKRVSFIKTDLDDKWPLDNNLADLATCSLILEHIDDLTTFFKQANDKLVTNGLFFICELHPFKQYIGSKARFESDEGVEVLQTFTHHISDFLESAGTNNFKLLELEEWLDDNEHKEVPRLISFVFRTTD
jgi:ubiquinone/menaquinone biosynthesis C-methylase UbiE